MNYLLDTCVISEFTRRSPDKNVIGWMDGIDEEKLYLSVITIGELQHGIERLEDSARKTELLAWMNDRLINRFSHRIIPLDTLTMLFWGSLMARLEKDGRPMPVLDSLLAASSLRNDLVLATRNLTDFTSSGVKLVNPWERK